VAPGRGGGPPRGGDEMERSAGRLLRASGVSLVLAASLGWGAAATEVGTPDGTLRVEVSMPASAGAGSTDGRVLLMLSTDPSEEPRFQINDSLKSQQVFGLDVEGLLPGQAAVFDASALGYPVASLAQVPAGTYTVEALLHRYETFRRADGHTVKLPMDRGEGQVWSRAPGNLYSTPQAMTIDPKRGGTVRLVVDKAIPPIPDPPDTKYVKHVRIQSERLTQFWGRPMFLGANVLLPEGWDTHPGARYPLIISHGHFPYDFTDIREVPPDPGLKPDFSERFQWAGYNRTEQEYAWQFFKDWTGPDFPRFLIIEIQHANPYYDDSYAVNSANLGPYGDAIVKELIPYIEKRFRGIGQGWARFMYGGSTGGWEAMGAQVFYPDDFNGAYIACPDPIDFRAYTVVDLYEDRNAYEREGPWKKVARPGHRNYLGHIETTIRDMNTLELVLGTRGRSGGQWDIWQAVYSPVGADGYPKPIWNKQTGVIDREVARYWRDHYDLSYILRRDWATLGPKLRGKLHIYVGDMDNYYLNNAVYLVEEFLKTAVPAYEGEVDYGDRAEHCWNGDHSRPNATSRLRYHQMFAPKILDRLLKTAPAGRDTVSWRY
jgi:hypothetical protein